MEDYLIDNGILKSWSNKNDANIIIPNGVIKIAGDNIQNSSPLDKTVKMEGPFYAAFMRNTKILSVEMPDTVQIVGAKAFEHCSNLRSVKFSKHLRKIEIMAFMGTKLETIEFSEGLKSIGWNAFSLNQNLKTIVLPKSLTDIEENAFSFNKDTIIKAPKDSYAIEYAKLNNVKYEEL